MVASDSFAEFLREQLAPLGRVTMRFGNTGVFCRGLMFAMVADNMLYFRVDDGNRPAFTVDHHSDLPSGAAQPYWYGDDRGFVIDHALVWGLQRHRGAR